MNKAGEGDGSWQDSLEHLHFRYDVKKDSLRKWHLN